MKSIAKFIKQRVDDVVFWSFIVIAHITVFLDIYRGKLSLSVSSLLPIEILVYVEAAFISVMSATLKSETNLRPKDAKNTK